MKRVIIIGALGSLLLSGCSLNSNKVDTDHNHHDHHEHISMGKDLSLKEVTLNLQTYPKFLDEYPDILKNPYYKIPNYLDIFRYIPCYCGCADYEGPDSHGSLLDCYITEIKDNYVEWTDHGANCGLCMEEANEVFKMADEGKSVKEIRDYIDNKYKSLGTNPTKTEMPPIY